MAIHRFAVADSGGALSTRREIIHVGGGVSGPWASTSMR